MVKKKIEKQEKLPKETKEKKEISKKDKKKIKKEEKSEEKAENEKEKKKEQEKMLVPLEDYIKAAVHLGTRAITPGMKHLVYRRRADGIAVLNTKKIDEKVEAAAKFLAQYKPEQITVCCKRDSGHKALEAFGKILGVRIFKKYAAGLITNPDLEDFFEPSVLFVIDPWLDKNALRDAVKIKIPTVALCDTNNPTEFIDFIAPCNNKTAKSIGLMLYIIAKIYLKERGEKKKLNAADFYELEEKKQEQTEQEKDEAKFASLVKKLKKKK